MFNIPFPGGAKDGDVFFHKDNACYYHEELNTWECRKVDTSTVNDPTYLTTADVYTLNVRPNNVRNPFELTDDPNTLVTQQEANWYLLEEIQQIIFIGNTPPPLVDGEQLYNFWYDTTILELFIWHNGAWFPTSVPPTDYGLEIEQFNFTINRLESLAAEAYAKNLEQDTSIDGIKNDIIELEEEIDALAPSLERGKWTFTAVGTVGQPGQFTMYDDEFGSGQPTGLFKSVRSIWFNEIDSDGTPHAFADVDDGELLEIFVDGSPEYGLYEVVGQAHDETQGASSFWVIDVNFVRTNEVTTAVGPGELCRFKIFMAPTGGDASSFVMKSGDTMTGRLQLDKPRGNNDNGQGFSVKGAIGDTYSSTTVSEQAGDLLQVYHNADAPDAINYKGKIQSPNNIATKGYVDASTTVSLTSGGNARWNSGSLPDSSLEGYRYFSIKQAGSTSSSVSLGNVLYLNKLIDSEGVLQRMDQYTPTDNSYFEAYLGTELVFKALLKPSTYKVASRSPDEIVCDFSYRYPLVSKGGSNWSTSSFYSLSLTGMKYTG